MGKAEGTEKQQAEGEPVDEELNAVEGAEALGEVGARGPGS